MSYTEGMVALVRGVLYRHQGGLWEEVGPDGHPTGNRLPGAYEKAIFGCAERGVEVEGDVLEIDVSKLHPHVSKRSFGILSSGGSGGTPTRKSGIGTSTAFSHTPYTYAQLGRTTEPFWCASPPASTAYSTSLGYGLTRLGTFTADGYLPYAPGPPSAGEGEKAAAGPTYYTHTLSPGGLVSGLLPYPGTPSPPGRSPTGVQEGGDSPAHPSRLAEDIRDAVRREAADAEAGEDHGAQRDSDYSEILRALRRDSRERAARASEPPRPEQAVSGGGLDKLSEALKQAYLRFDNAHKNAVMARATHYYWLGESVTEEEFHNRMEAQGRGIKSVITPPPP